ncbi:hypothetical protein AVEN_56048-1 [Araneus ventricosus]|uniref:Uncharacterized protein n=1 Tax=Araneus ventricosus TaxID=182803 RepID=A0A4Y2DNH5_ARAVE|nr:hypothetical protein AVEN_56048-1 [Araneus ventricosus]
MRHNLHIFPHKIQTRQPLSVNALDSRYDFVNAMLKLVDKGDIDVGHIWFSDEANFNLDGFVNKQNWRTSGTENPHVAVPSYVLCPPNRYSCCNGIRHGDMGRDFLQRNN